MARASPQIWVRAASDGVCPARRGGEQRPAQHRTAQKHAAKEQVERRARGRARGRARSQEGGGSRGRALAQSRPGSHTAVRGAPTCAAPPLQAGTRPAGTRVPCHAAPRPPPPATCCREGVACRGSGCTPHRPVSPHRDPAKHSRVGEGAGPSGWKAMGSQRCCVDWAGNPHFCVYFLAAMDGDRQALGEDTPLCPGQLQPHLPVLHL